MPLCSALNLCGFGVVAALAVAPALAQGNKPNVVFILADNVGYGDLGPYGGGELRGAPTPRIDELAREGLRFTQFLVEPACTPSRAALMTGQYSIRNGLSLIIVPGSQATLVGPRLHYGRHVPRAWLCHGDLRQVASRLGSAEPADRARLRRVLRHPARYVLGLGHLCGHDHAHALDRGAVAALLAKGPHIVEATAGGPLHDVKPFTPEVRAGIDYELVDKSIDFMKRQHAAGKPFFLYLPFSMGHVPNLPAKEFAGKSRIGNYGDKLMEGDYHVGQILDTLKDLGIDNNTIVMFASDNGPYGETVREFGNQGTPDMGNSGPFRGELGEVSEGSIRTFAFIRWPGHVKPNTTSYAMFSIMDFFPTLASIVGGKMPTDRPIDGMDQSDVLFGKSAVGHRNSLLSFIGPQLVAARWKQWRIYFTDMHPTGIGPQRLPGLESSSASMAGYPKVYNIEMDPHEDLNVAGLFGWVGDPALEAVRRYEASVREHPNPPAPNITVFGRGG